MPCLTPITLKRSYMTMNGGFTDIFPCGKCPECLRKRQNDWVFRLSQEKKHATSAVFLTLTYSEENLIFGEIHPTLHKRDYQNFMKRLRKHVNDKNIKIKYYACGEYGGITKRPHYHAIMYNLPPGYISNSNFLTNIWQNGHVDIGTCTGASIRYVAKYIMKGRLSEEELEGRMPEFSLMSKKLGIGYLTPSMITHLNQKMQPYTKIEGGKLQPLPRYFKHKIFTKPERQQLAINSLEYAQERIDAFRDSKHELDYKKQKFENHEKQLKLERTKI